MTDGMNLENHMINTLRNEYRGKLVRFHRSKEVLRITDVNLDFPTGLFYFDVEECSSGRSRSCIFPGYDRWLVEEPAPTEQQS